LKADHSIDWEKIVEFNSARKKQKKFIAATQITL